LQSSQLVLLSASDGLPSVDDDTELVFGLELELRESSFGRSRVSTVVASAGALVWAWWEGCLLRAGGVMVARVRGERGLGGVEARAAMAVGGCVGGGSVVWWGGVTGQSQELV